MGMVLVVALTLFLAVLGYFFLNYSFKEEGEDKKFLDLKLNKKALIVAGIFFVIGILTGLFEIYHEKAATVIIMSYLMLLSVLYFAAIVDFKKSIIPNSLIIAGLIMYLTFALISIFAVGVNAKSFLLISVAGGLIIGGLLLLVMLVSKNALGMGDVKLFFVVGLMLGLKNCYEVLLISMVIMALTAIVLLLLKKVDRKTAVPMAPFMTIGFMICLALGM